MTFLPIVVRELRVASRKRGTYWLRTGAATAVIFLGAWFVIMMRNESPRSLSTALFYLLTGSAVAYGLFSGARATADALSEEKREGTLGLLFLTDLKGYDVVFGKLVARSVTSLFNVLAVVPMLAIPLLLGGVAPAEFGRMALVALNALFFSLGLGLMVSAMSRSVQKSFSLTTLLLLVFTAVLPACGGLLMASGRTPTVWPVFLLPSAGFTYFAALDVSYRPRPEAFWFSMLLIHIMGWLSLVIASLVAPRSWQDKPPGAQVLRWREKWLLLTHGDLRERAAFRRSLLEQNAFFWLAARKRFKPAMVWTALGLVALLWLWGLLKFKREWLNEGVYVSTAVLLNVLLRNWFGGEAIRQLAEDRKAGAFELLLPTALTIPDILRGQWLALQRQFVGPVLAVLAFESIFMLAPLGRTMLDAGDKTLWVGYWLGGMLMFVADLAALYWVGMWQGLSARNQSRATVAAFGQIFIWPWITMAVFMLLMVIAVTVTQGPEPDVGPKFFLGLWLVTGLIFDVACAAYARHKLLTQFRFAAEQRFAPMEGFWSRLFGALKR